MDTPRRASRQAAIKAEESLDQIAKQEYDTRVELYNIAEHQERSAHIINLPTQVVSLSVGSSSKGRQVLRGLALEDPAAAAPVQPFVTLRMQSEAARCEFRRKCERFELAARARVVDIDGDRDVVLISDEEEDVGLPLYDFSHVAPITPISEKSHSNHHRLDCHTPAGPLLVGTRPAGVPIPCIEFRHHPPIQQVVQLPATGATPAIEFRDNPPVQQNIQVPAISIVPTVDLRRRLPVQHFIQSPAVCWEDVSTVQPQLGARQGQENEQEQVPLRSNTPPWLAATSLLYSQAETAIEQSVFSPTKTLSKLPSNTPHHCPTYRFVNGIDDNELPMLHGSESLPSPLASSPTVREMTPEFIPESLHTLCDPTISTNDNYKFVDLHFMEAPPRYLHEHSSYRVGPSLDHRLMKYQPPPNGWEGPITSPYNNDYSDPRFWSAKTEHEQECIWQALGPTRREFFEITGEFFNRDQAILLPFGYDSAYSHIHNQFSRWCFENLGFKHRWTRGGALSHKLFKLQRWYGLIENYEHAPNWPYRLQDDDGRTIQNPDVFACTECIESNFFCHGHRENHWSRCIPCQKNQRECSKRLS